MSGIDLEAERLRAGEARQIMEAPIFVAARRHLEEQLANSRRKVPLRDTDMHTRLILMEQLAGTFFDYFEQLAQTGKMAEMQLREAEEKRSIYEQGLSLFRQRGRNY